jgi:stage II sporulation protein D
VLRAVPCATPVTFRSDPAAGLIRFEVGGAMNGTDATWVRVRPVGAGPLEIGGRPYRGTALVQTARTGRVTAINQLGMEDYLLGVVPQEIGAIGDTLIEAAKAQAVAARTYAVTYMGRRSALGFDVFATVADQVYGGLRGEHPSVSRAVRETAGEILVFNGAPITAYYHSTCSGRTVPIHEAWPGEAPVAYLSGIVDVDPQTGQPYDTRSSRFRWTVRWDADTLARILSRTLADSLAPGTSIGRVTNFEITGRTPTGRVRELRITTTTRTFTLSGHEYNVIRRTLMTPQGAPLNSSNFDVQVERNAAGELTAVVATGGGWGHGIGMCQVGAMGRARAGQSYRTILSAYYPGTEIQDRY